MKFERAHIVKLIVLAVYICVIAAVFTYVRLEGVHFSDIPHLVSMRVAAAKGWGPLILVAMFAAQTIIPFSGIGLNVVAGGLYGPWLGILISLIGMNMAAAINFFIGRFLGRHLISEHERGWVKKYDDLLTEQGFISIFAMRVLHFPFDFVSLGAGMTRMTYRQYAAGTFLGSLPGVVTFAVLGDAVDSPRSWVLFFILLVISLAIVWFMRRSKWAKTHLFKKIEPEQLG